MSGPRSVQPLVGVLAVIYLVFVGSLAHTTLIAIRAKTAAAAGLETSTLSIKIQKAISQLHRKLDHLHYQVHDREESSSRQSEHVTQHLQQLKLDLLKQVSSQVAKSLANQTSDFEKLHHQLKGHTSMIDNRESPQAQAEPTGAQVANHELHHIATEKDVCDKHDASGLTLNITEDLIAPVVLVGHNRPGYMARTIIQLMK